MSLKGGSLVPNTVLSYFFVTPLSAVLTTLLAFDVRGFSATVTSRCISLVHITGSLVGKYTLQMLYGFASLRQSCCGTHHHRY